MPFLNTCLSSSNTAIFVDVAPGLMTKTFIRFSSSFCLSFYIKLGGKMPNVSPNYLMNNFIIVVPPGICQCSRNYFSILCRTDKNKKLMLVKTA